MLWIYDLSLPVLCFTMTAIPTLVAIGCTMLAYRMHWILKAEDGQSAAAVHAFVGVVYAVALALIVVSVQEAYSQVEAASVDEASSAGNLFRDVAGLDPVVRDRLQAKVSSYVKSVIEDEWPAIQRRRPSDRAPVLIRDLANDIVHVVPNNSHEEAILAKVLQDSDDLFNSRHERLYYGQDGIGGTTWMVIVVGGIITVLFASLLHWERRSVHLAAMGLAGAMLGLMFFLIVAMDRPLWGDGCVQPDAFRAELAVFEETLKTRK